MTIGERIKNLRKGYNQKQFAKRCGMNQPALCQYEKGIRTPSIEALKKISKTCNVSVDYLVGNKTDDKEIESDVGTLDANIIRKLIETYGENHQLLKLLEEMDELGKEIIKYVTKYMREGQSFECTELRQNIVEEIADVELCLAQCKYMFGILNSELEKVKDEKIKRLGV